MALKELDAIPELRDDPSLKDFTDVTTLAKSFRDTKAFVGSSIRPPSENASDADKAEFYTKLQKHAPHLVPLDDTNEAAQELVWSKLGRPKDPKEYDFKPPEGVTVDLDGLRAVAVATGMTKKQFEKAALAAATHAEKSAAQRAADKAALKAEWGAAYDKKLADAADAAAKAEAPEPVVKAIAEGRLPSGELKLWANVAKSIGAEGTVIGKQGTSQAGGALTPAEAEAEISEIMRNPLYMDRNGGAARDRLIQRVVKLQGFVTPEQR